MLMQLSSIFIKIKCKAEDIPVSLKSVTDNKYIYLNVIQQNNWSNQTLRIFAQ